MDATVPAADRARRTDVVIQTCRGVGPRRWKDRASGRIEPEPGLVLAAARQELGAGRCTPPYRARGRPTAYVGEPAARQRRLRWRALARHLRPAGVERLKRGL